MAVSFLVEFRLHGYAKEYAKWAISRVHREAKRLGIRGQKQVPHISLFGSAETNSLRRVISEVEKIGRKYTLVPFRIDGFSRFDKPHKVIYLDIDPSPELERFRQELAESLVRISRRYTEWDTKQRYKFHSTIGIFATQDDRKFDQLYAYAENHCRLEDFRQHKASILAKLVNIIKRYILRVEEEEEGISQYLLRVTILGKRSRIQCEYDLVLKRVMSRRQALSRYWWRRTVEKLRELQSPPQEERLAVSSESVYFIGDTHFDHKNIIKYCHRPFSSVAEMNEVMKDNWNSTVGDDDTVYFLGDWSFGRGARPADYWMRQLRGHIVSIRGSHDREVSSIRFERAKALCADDYSFLLIHNPEGRNTKWHGWVIHGHVHNNKMDEYPFINGERRTINVSAELINYKPVSLGYLLSLDLDSIKQMRTIDSQPERW